MPQPDFNDSSWDNTIWSLWGVLYSSKSAESDRGLRNGITTRYDEVQKLLGSLGPQTGKLKKLVASWRREVDGYGRTIVYSEAAKVLARLDELHEAVTAQCEADRLLVAAKKKPPPREPSPPSRSVTPPSPVVESDDEVEDEDDQGLDQFVAFYRKNSVMGHSAQTAKAKPVARPYVPPTPAENWVSAQRAMANECDNGIAFGAHDVDQESVLRHLHLAQAVSVSQYRSGPENSHKRIMKAGKEQFWTLGLTHREKRDRGEFSVYRRDGNSNKFTHVSGQRRPEHIAAEPDVL